MFPGLNEVKILGPKNHGQEIMTSQYQDIKLLSPYEQFLKNTASNTNGCDSGGVNTSGCRKEVKILGKKLGTGIITSTEEGNVVEVIEEKTKLVRDPTIAFDSPRSPIVLSSSVFIISIKIWNLKVGKLKVSNILISNFPFLFI